MASMSTSSSLNPSILGLSNRNSGADNTLPSGGARASPALHDSPAAAHSNAGDQSAGAATQSDAGAPGDSESPFMCNICLSLPTQPVATFCGHVFCWGCLYKWLSVQNNEPACPVCKAVVEIPNFDPSKAKVIPLYVNGKSETDPRTTFPEEAIPSRPQSERPPQQQQHPRNFAAFPGPFGFNGHVSVSNGLGLLPSLIGLTFLPNGPFQQHMHPGGHAAGGQGGDPITVASQEEAHQQEFLSRVLFMIGTFIALCLIFFP